VGLLDENANPQTVMPCLTRNQWQLLWASRQS